MTWFTIATAVYSGKAVPFKPSRQVVPAFFAKSSINIFLFVISFMNKNVDVKINIALFEAIYFTITQENSLYIIYLKNRK